MIKVRRRERRKVGGRWRVGMGRLSASERRREWRRGGQLEGMVETKTSEVLRSSGW